MQQELKYEAYRVEAITKSASHACFDRCVAAPPHIGAVLQYALPDHIPQLQKEPTEGEMNMKMDLTSEEALCLDRCAWKYMHTAKIVLQTLNKAKNLQQQKQAQQ